MVGSVAFSCLEEAGTTAGTVDEAVAALEVGAVKGALGAGRAAHAVLLLGLDALEHGRVGDIAVLGGGGGREGDAGEGDDEEGPELHVGGREVCIFDVEEKVGGGRQNKIWTGRCP